MSTMQWLLVAASFLLVGAAFGAWGAARRERARAQVELRRAVETVEHKHQASLGLLRAAHARAQAELEQTRNNFKRQLLIAANEPRAELARVSGRLQIAYAELDRLRAQLQSAQTAPHPDLADGFAATQPMPSRR